jgi:hypothetical protein
MDVTQSSDTGSCELAKCLPYFFLGVGISLLCMLGLGVGRGFGLLFGATFCIHLILLVICVIGSIRQILRALVTSGAIGKLTIGTLVIVLGGELLLGALPITAIDALVHHLAVPKWWEQAGYLIQIPWHEWSYYPMLLNLGYTGLLILRLDQFTPYYHLCYLLVTLGLVAWVLERTSASKTVTSLSLALIGTLPIFLKLGGDPLVDLGLSAFAALAVCFLTVAIEKPSERKKSSQSRVALVSFGISLGLAAGTKLNGALFAVCLIATLPFLREWRETPRSAMAFVAGAFFLTYSPWMIRNWIWTDNPVYPLFKSWFTARIQGVEGNAPYLPPLLHRHEIYGESWVEIALLPLRVLLGGVDGNPQFFDGSGSPLLALVFIAPFIRLKSSVTRLVFPAAMAYLLLALFVSIARVRYFAPTLPLLCVVAAEVLAGILTACRASYRRFLEWGVLAFILVSAGYYLNGKFQGAPIAFFTGKITRSEFISSRIPEYPLIEYANKRLPSHAHVYLLGTSNPFYLFDVGSSSAGYYSFREIVAWSRDSRSPEEILTKFKQRSISHLLINTARLKEAIGRLESQEAIQRWNEFSSHYLSPIAESGAFSLWGVAYQ